MAATLPQASIDALAQALADALVPALVSALAQARPASGSTKSVAVSMSDARAAHTAPCGRGFTTDANLDAHVAYALAHGGACVKGDSRKGHGPRAK
jgi:hypothetical protein